jgi:hypothetical protein
MLYRLALACLLLASPALAHDWYTGLQSPMTGKSCCNDRDCRPVEHRYNPTLGRLEVEVQGHWFPVDPATILTLPSPDGGVHACYSLTWQSDRTALPTFHCVILPGST